MTYSTRKRLPLKAFRDTEPGKNCKGDCPDMPEVDRRPQRIRTKYEITRDTRETCFPYEDCDGRPMTPCEFARYEAYVRPRGTTTWVLAYPAFDLLDNGHLCFRWDDNLFNLGSDRLEVEFRHDGEPVGSIELRIITQRTLNLECGSHSESDPYSGPDPLDPEVHRIFDEVYLFESRLNRILERGDSQLHMCDEHAGKLCEVSLCRPVELVIDDGVNHEIVLFKGCNYGAIVVNRGRANTTPKRFPVGAKVKFAWTPYNIQAAKLGCP